MSTADSVLAKNFLCGRVVLAIKIFYPQTDANTIKLDCLIAYNCLSVCMYLYTLLYVK